MVRELLAANTVLEELTLNDATYNDEEQHFNAYLEVASPCLQALSIDYRAQPQAICALDPVINFSTFPCAIIYILPEIYGESGPHDWLDAVIEHIDGVSAHDYDFLELFSGTGASALVWSRRNDELKHVLHLEPDVEDPCWPMHSLVHLICDADILADLTEITLILSRWDNLVQCLAEAGISSIRWLEMLTFVVDRDEFDITEVNPALELPNLKRIDVNSPPDRRNRFWCSALAALVRALSTGRGRAVEVLFHGPQEFTMMYGPLAAQVRYHERFVPGWNAIERYVSPLAIRYAAIEAGERVEDGAAPGSCSSQGHCGWSWSDLCRPIEWQRDAA